MRTHFILEEITPSVAADFYDWVIDLTLSVPSKGVAIKPEVLISSPGGDVGLMVGIYDAIVRKHATTIASGILQSAAAVLFQAGSRRSMTPNSLLLFHEPERAPNGDFSDADWYLFTKMVELVAMRTGLLEPEVHDLFDGKFINAQRALQLGLCDEIIGEKDGRDHSVSGSEGSDSGDHEQSPQG